MSNRFFGFCRMNVFTEVSIGSQINIGASKRAHGVQWHPINVDAT